MSDGSLPAALDGLYGAVAALVDPRKELLDGVLHAAPALYDELVGNLPAGGAKGFAFQSGFYRSASPLWLDALDLRVQIDQRVKSWHPKGTSTPDRLRGYAGGKHRPQDAKLIEQRTAELAGFALSIRALVIDPAHVKVIAEPCPSCGTRYVYRQHAGERVRTPALQLVTEQGCTCLSCRAFWPPQHYLLLAKVLGFDVPAGVLG